MGALELGNFTEIPRRRKARKLHLTVMNEQMAYIPTAMANELSPFIRLYTDASGNQILVRKEVEAAGYRVQIGNKVSLPAFADALLARGVALPARYEMRRTEVKDEWLGTLVPSTPGMPPKVSKIPEKPRVTGLSDMMPKRRGRSCKATDD